MISDRRDDMSLIELLEELELRYPEKVADFERQYVDVFEALFAEDIFSVPRDDLDELMAELRDLLRI